jgi:phosphatidylinositol alpha-mannosyltransferase
MTFRGAPVVGTFHAYSTKAFPNYVATMLGARRRFNQLSARIAVSEAAAWTGRRWFGGDYTIVPNGVDVAAAPQGPKKPSDELRLLFVGRAEERKGLPVLLAAFQALVEHVPSRLTVVGADPEDLARLIADPDLLSHIDVLGKVSDSVLWRQLGEADLLCAPSLTGESFGMVLIEAMAAGTPVVASDIDAFRRVLDGGQAGALFPVGDATGLADTVVTLLADPSRRARLSAQGSRVVAAYDWDVVTADILHVYETVTESAVTVGVQPA